MNLDNSVTTVSDQSMVWTISSSALGKTCNQIQHGYRVWYKTDAPGSYGQYFSCKFAPEELRRREDL